MKEKMKLVDYLCIVAGGAPENYLEYTTDELKKLIEEHERTSREYVDNEER